MDSDILIENKVKKDILNSVNNLKKNHSRKIYNELISDFLMLYEIANTFKLKDILNNKYYQYLYFNNNLYEKNYKKINFNQKSFYKKNYEFNSELTDNYTYILNKYTDSSFEYNLTKMSIQESQDLVAEFLINFDSKIYNCFKKCVMDNKFIYLNCEEYGFSYDGLTLYGKFFKPYVLIDDQESIFTALTSVHEIGHIYDFQNKKINKYNYCLEIYSHFLELVFGDYLIENKIESKNVKYNYLDNLEETIIDLSNLLKENINTNLNFKVKYNQIYSILEYTYGMVLALEFYDIYLKDKELGIYKINEFSKTKDRYNNINQLIKKFNFDKEEILEGEKLKRFIKTI